MLKRFAVTELCLLAGAVVALGPSSAFAQNKATTFDVRLTIDAECVLSGATDMDFGKVGVLDRNIDAESVITVECPDGTPYEVALNGGLDGDRDLDGPDGDFVSYGLYQDAARTREWGGESGVDVADGDGDGFKQELKVYGRVPPQDVVGVGVYADTVTVSLIY